MREEVKLKVGKSHTFHNIAEKLCNLGYERVETLNKPGDFSIAGGNLLIFSANYKDPIRLDFFGDYLEKIITFHLGSGKASEKFDEISISANIIFLPDGTKIKPDDYVVHDDHGIGQYSHSETKLVEGERENYIVIRYLNDNLLYVPFGMKDKISLYIGVGQRRPKLNKLGSQTWNKTYKKTYDNVIKMAKELLLLYAKRELEKRKRWTINKDWNKEIAATFGYEETKDQKEAIEKIFEDLQKDIPMDRLVCGDVGFGKTEVALRAACQAFANGYQAAILVPTTILAEQHFAMIRKRFRDLPVTVEHLSRFVNQKKQAEVIKNISEGKVDLVIGTHKLFNTKIKYKNLGLLIIDEEQKFGVKDKEKLKKLKASLNVLSLTATPIPRTLFMALSGIRDLSQISSAPIGRKGIETEIAIYNEGKIKQKIEQEINRKGQVYFLHNEVRTIGGRKNKLEKLFPNLKIAAAHGQQSEGVLAKTMVDFAEGKIDLLVCSTIIENGLDLPNANTLIVEGADRFGLSQLYQIRGRIGRSSKQAYALFTYKDKKITNNAFKRLKALAENTELGSGYQIALSDLEIRGGGNVLGREQHGNMEAVGLVLYTKLLNSAVKNIKKVSNNSNVVL